MSNALDLVGLAEVAERLGRPTVTVRWWRQHDAMPKPDAELACGPVWRWQRVEKWARSTDKMRKGGA